MDTCILNDKYLTRLGDKLRGKSTDWSNISRSDAWKHQVIPCRAILWVNTAAMLRWYQLKLAQRPLLTQSITTAVLFATGDVMAQQAVERVGFDKHNFARTGRMALYGGAVFGPAATTWFKFLQNRINLKNPNTTIAARVLADQCVFASTNLFVFLSSMAIMEGTSPKDKLESTYTTALSKNWMVWPWVQAINFKLVPLEHRVLVVNIVSLGWNCYLSYINSKGGK